MCIRFQYLSVQWTLTMSSSVSLSVSISIYMSKVIFIFIKQKNIDLITVSSLDPLHRNSLGRWGGGITSSRRREARRERAQKPRMPCGQLTTELNTFFIYFSETMASAPQYKVTACTTFKILSFHNLPSLEQIFS